MNPLYHFTCADGATAIERARELIPNPQPVLDGAPLVWLTDLPDPDAQGLGLTADWIRCDRTQYRVTVEATPDTVRWGHWAHDHPLPRILRDRLEDGRLPAHWWVSERAVPILEITRRT